MLHNQNIIIKNKNIKMGACNSADNIDRACTHNKQYVALCTGDGCSRENGDRRMCKECLEDHMCTDRVTIDDGID